MRFFTIYLVGLFFLTSCVQTLEKEFVDHQKEDIISDVSAQFSKNAEIHGMGILTTGPRGGAYLSSTGTNFRYTIFRIQVLNDTLIPIKLDLNFPTSPIKLLPDSTIILEVFLVPDTFTPDSIQDVFNFGVRLEDFFESGNNPQLALSASIQPNEQQTMYVAVLVKNKPINGKTRTKLFVEGHDNDAPFFPVNSSEKYKVNSSPINLIYGISVDPPNHYALIPCGQIYLKK